jgi:hypothetical protein
MKKKKDKSKQRLLILMAVLLVCILGGLLILHFENNGDPERTGLQQEKGERHQGWTPFYHASGGSWQMLDEASYVLREQKFVSSDSERYDYLVKKVLAGGVLKIIEARGRWKKVQVIENEEIVATGWIDAHNIKKVEKINVPKNITVRD